jgi:hypothetical protein
MDGYTKQSSYFASNIKETPYKAKRVSAIGDIDGAHLL